MILDILYKHTRKITGSFLYNQMKHYEGRKQSTFMKMFTLYIITFMSFVLVFAVVPQITLSKMSEGEKPPENAVKKSRMKEREAKAYEIFEEILILTETSGDKDVFKDIENLYLKIISEYSDTALAQECYWRLIMHYVEKRTPPMFENAENLHAEFLKKYPGSVINTLIVDTLSKGYHRNGDWEKLLTLNSNAVKSFYKTGKLSNPSPLFMYAEAQFNLGDLGEAEKAYNSILEKFPNSRMASQSKRRIEEINKKTNTSN